MSMTADFYSFNKRRNSTKIPDAQMTPTSLTIVLKSPTSYRNPSLHVISSGGFHYNYMDWSGWLYWIEDVVSVGNDRYEIRCSLDALGTLRAYILNTTAFVLYDETANSEIPDTRLSTNTTRGFRSASDEFNSIGQLSSPADAIVVVGITSKDGVSFFAMSQLMAQTLLRDVNNTELPQLFPAPGSGAQPRSLTAAPAWQRVEADKA